MKKNSFVIASYAVMLLSVVFYLIALCFGIKSGGTVALVFLGLAALGAVLTLAEAVYERRSVYAYIYRSTVFFACLASIFYNLGWTGLELFAALIASLCGVFTFARFVYQMNKYCVRNAEAHLDD